MRTPGGSASESGALRIGALARLAGLSPDTLRHYERVGVLPAPHRSENGYREYPPQALARVRLVKRALTCGFTLAELAGLLTVRDRGGAPCRRVRALAARKLAGMEREVARLVARCEALRVTLTEWDRRLSATPRGRPARLLDHLAAEPSDRRRARPPGRWHSLR